MVDVSSNNHVGGRPLDFGAMRRECGIDYVMIKATEGLGYRNPYLAEDARAAHEAGMDVGYYHFAHPCEAADVQVADFLNGVRYAGVPHRLGLALDLEVQDGLNWADLAEFAQTFLDSLSRAAQWTILYSNEDFLTNMPGAPWGYRLWYARPGARPRRQCWAWQYGTGREPAVEGIDVDELFELPA